MEFLFKCSYKTLTLMSNRMKQLLPPVLAQGGIEPKVVSSPRGHRVQGGIEPKGVLSPRRYRAQGGIESKGVSSPRGHRAQGGIKPKGIFLSYGLRHLYKTISIQIGLSILPIHLLPQMAIMLPLRTCLTQHNRNLTKAR